MTWSVVRVGWVFSESLNDMSLGRSAEEDPGGPPGIKRGSAGWSSGNSDKIGRLKQDRPGWVVRAWARSAVDDFITTAYPAECRVCGCPLVRAGTIPVCDSCVGRVGAQTGLLCAICGEAMGMEDERFAEGFLTEPPRCTPCRRVPPAFARAVAYGVYEGPLREMIHLLKYERVRSLARPLGGMLARAAALLKEQIESSEGGLLVVAVPLYRGKERGRGFNHAELLADAAVRELKRQRPEWRLCRAHGALSRVRETESQFGLTPHARRSNLRGAFAVRDADAVTGRDVLLIDDIYTTGAMARVCSQVLRRAGARSVLVVTLARAQVEAVALWDGEATSRSLPVEGFGQVVRETGGHR